jgi:hypothetical protein
LSFLDHTAGDFGVSDDARLILLVGSRLVSNEDHLQQYNSLSSTGSAADPGVAQSCATIVAWFSASLLCMSALLSNIQDIGHVSTRSTLIFLCYQVLHLIWGSRSVSAVVAQARQHRNLYIDRR